MLEGEKGCSPTPVPPRLYTNSVTFPSGFPVLWSTADCLHVTHCILLPIKLEQPFIPKVQGSQAFPQTSHDWTHQPLVACLEWTRDVHIFSSLREREHIAMARVNCYGCVAAGDGCTSSLRVMKYSNAGSVRMCEAGKVLTY